MDMEPLVSVIIPYYNSEKYFGRCIESVVSSSYKNLEVILVNDGSDDGSEAIAIEYAQKDDRVKNINVPHGGVSRARNKGLEEAGGEYVMFVDSDDWISSDIIEHMSDVMQQTGAEMATCEIVSPEGGEACTGTGEHGYEVVSKDDYLRKFFKIDSNEWLHYPWAKIYKKSLLPQPFYPENIRVGEDVLGTYLAVRNTEKIVRMKEKGYFYFVNPKSVSSLFSEMDFDLIPVWNRMVEESIGQEPDHYYAQINRDRVYFTLLFRMITEVPKKTIKEKYSMQQDELRNELKKREKSLLRAPIVFSRKALIFILCHFFPLASFFGNMYVRSSNKRGVQAGLSRRRFS